MGVEITFVTYYFMRSRLDTNKIEKRQYQSAPHKISVIQKIFSTRFDSNRNYRLDNNVINSLTVELIYSVEKEILLPLDTSGKNNLDPEVSSGSYQDLLLDFYGNRMDGEDT